MIHMPGTAWYICPGCKREIAASAKSNEAGLCPECLVKADIERTRGNHWRRREVRLCPVCQTTELRSGARYCPPCAAKRRKETHRMANQRRAGVLGTTVVRAGMQKTAEKPANGGPVFLPPANTPKRPFSET